MPDGAKSSRSVTLLSSAHCKSSSYPRLGSLTTDPPSGGGHTVHGTISTRPLSSPFGSSSGTTRLTPTTTTFQMTSSEHVSSESRHWLTANTTLDFPTPLRNRSPPVLPAPCLRSSHGGLWRSSRHVSSLVVKVWSRRDADVPEYCSQNTASLR